jgi:hypothetical protein
MTLLIVPILIRVAAGALSRGAGVAIARWSAGNAVKKYVATKVAEKAIDEGRKMALGQSQRWQAAFKKDPSEAMRDAAVSFVNSEARDLLAKNTDINPELVDGYRNQLIQQVGEEVIRRATRGNYGQQDTVLEFDRDAVADRAVENVLARGLALAEARNGKTTRQPLDGGLNGESEGVDRGRSLATYADDPAEAEEVIRASARSAFDETFDERELTRTIVGTDDSVQRAVQRPIEEMTADAFDINKDIAP